MPKPESLFDLNYFKKRPDAFAKFSREFLFLNKQVSPTLAHHFVTSLE